MVALKVRADGRMVNSDEGKMKGLARRYDRR